MKRRNTEDFGKKKMTPVYKNPQNRETEQHLHDRGDAKRQYFNPLRRGKRAEQFINL